MGMSDRTLTMEPVLPKLPTHETVISFKAVCLVFSAGSQDFLSYS